MVTTHDFMMFKMVGGWKNKYEISGSL